MNTDVETQNLDAAAEAIKNAEFVLLAAGAGMGVDSGMPDFRGNEGFWKAYPPFRELGLSFVELANPCWFETDPHLAWGFYGHRRNLYLATEPHQGFQLLREMTVGKTTFIFTSNVDGHFQKAGFSSRIIEECHGSLNHLQCTNKGCIARHKAIWAAENLKIEIDSQTFRAVDPLPRCSKCGSLARPNVLMFGDADWVEDRTLEQYKRLTAWERSVTGPVVIIECGAGKAVPSVRNYCEAVSKHFNAPLIRINVREPEGPQCTIPLAMGALQGLTEIASRI